MNPDYNPIPTSALLMLATLILRRAGLEGMPNTNRAQALSVIRGVRPSPTRSSILKRRKR